MAFFSVPTDETLQSTLEYGKAEFPFAYYRDDLSQYQSQCIEWHWHNEFEFSYVLEGTVICHIGGEQIVLEAGDGLFINSGTIHRFETESQGVFANYIFSPELLAETTSLIYLHYVFPVVSNAQGHVALHKSREEETQLLDLLRELNEVCQGNGFGKELRIHNLISGIWYLLVQRHGSLPGTKPEQKDGRTIERLQTMMDFIHTHYHGKISLEEIAEAANVSKSEALRCFHQGIQSTPIRYLNEYRLGRAREALLSSSDSVSAISAAVGFESVGYFCQTFKKHTGTSPGAFRKEHFQLESGVWK